MGHWSAPTTIPTSEMAPAAMTAPMKTSSATVSGLEWRTNRKRSRFTATPKGWVAGGPHPSP